jgi:hypothetical protein
MKLNDRYSVIGKKSFANPFFTRGMAAILLGAGAGLFAADKHQLEFNGNRVFSAKELRQGLAASVDYSFVAHPLAKDDEFAGNLEHLLRMAYADRGYADARITVSKQGAEGKWPVNIKEGALFKCGRVIVPAKGNPLAKELAVFLSQPIQESLSDEKWDFFNLYLEADWVAGQTAKLTRVRLESLGWNARWFCFMKGYPKTKAHLRLRPRAGGVMDLEVVMDLGKRAFGDDVKGVVRKLGEIKVHGCQANKPEAVLEFLKIKPGMPVEVLMERKLEEELERSGRFAKQAVRLRKPDGKGVAGLDIHVTECPHVPPLSKRLSGKAKTALGIHRELMSLKLGGASWRIDFSVDASGAKPEARKKWTAIFGSDRGHARLVLSGGGLGIAVRTPAKNGPGELGMAGVFAKGTHYGVYLPDRKIKWVPGRVGTMGGAVVKVAILPASEPNGKGRFTLGGQFSVDSTEPLDIRVNFPAAAVLYELHRPESKLRQFFVDNLKLDSHKETVVDGVTIHRLLATHRQTGQPFTLEYRADAHSRPLSLKVDFVLEGVKMNLVISKAKGAMDELIRSVEAETKTIPNLYQPGHGFSSLAGAATSHFVPLFMDWYTHIEKSFKQESGVARAANRFLDQAKLKMLQALGPRLREGLEPLDELFVSSGPFEIRRGIFQDVPAPPVVRVDGETELIPIGSRTVWLYSNESAEFDFRMRPAFTPDFSGAPGLFMLLSAFRQPLFAEDSWPAIVLREAELAGIHSTEYTEAALVQMAESGKGGSLACLIAAQLLNSLDSPAGMRCASLGLQHLNENGIQLDAQPFLDPKSPLIRSGNRFLAQTKPALRKEIVTAITAQFLGKQEQEALAEKLDDGKIEAVHVANPVIKNLLKQITPSLAMDLQIAQFGSKKRIRAQAETGDANCQFLLALFHFQGRGMPVDLVEAYTWAARAARQGHRDAARLRGTIVEQMTAKQLFEGMKRVSE